MCSPIPLVLLSCLITAQEPTKSPGAEVVAPARQGDPTVLAGRCLDLDGKPAARVKVEVYLRDFRADRTDLVRVTVADEAGRFRVEGLRALTEEDWGWTYHFLVGRSSDRALAVATIRSLDVPQNALQLVFGEAASVMGEVVDERGNPIAAARIWVWVVEALPTAPAYNEISTSEALVGWSARTDEKGEFRIRNLPKGAKIRLKSQHPVFAQTRMEAAVPDDLRIEMAPGSTIAGRVVYPDGEPVAFARVQCQGAQRSSWATTRADEQGFYRLESLPEEPYNVWVVLENWTVAALASFPVALGEVVNAPDLVLSKGGFIVGRVVDAATGKGVKPGVRGDVGLYGPSRPRPGAAIEVGKIEPDGRFEIRAAPGSNYVYLRCGKGWIPAGPKSFDVVVVEGEKVTVEFRVRYPER